VVCKRQRSKTFSKEFLRDASTCVEISSAWLETKPGLVVQFADRWRDRFLGSVAFTEPIRVELWIGLDQGRPSNDLRCQNKLCHQRKGKWKWNTTDELRSLLLTARSVGQHTWLEKKWKRNGDVAESQFQGRLITTSSVVARCYRIVKSPAILCSNVSNGHAPHPHITPAHKTTHLTGQLFFFTWPLSQLAAVDQVPPRGKNLFYSQKLHECILARKCAGMSCLNSCIYHYSGDTNNCDYQLGFQILIKLF